MREKLNVNGILKNGMENKKYCTLRSINRNVTLESQRERERVGDLGMDVKGTVVGC